MTVNKINRIIVALSGASGAILGIRTIQLLQKNPNIHIDVIMSRAYERTLITETDYKPDDIREMADKVHSHTNIGADIASGSCGWDAMIVVPCSIKTLSEIANSLSGNLITRCADVALKERRKLLLGVREMPLHGIHLGHMKTLSDMGAIIAPPVMAHYHRPKTLDDMETYVCQRYLDLIGVSTDQMPRWNG